MQQHRSLLRNIYLRGMEGKGSFLRVGGKYRFKSYERMREVVPVSVYAETRLDTVFYGRRYYLF